MFDTESVVNPKTNVLIGFKLDTSSGTSSSPRNLSIRLTATPFYETRDGFDMLNA